MKKLLSAVVAVLLCTVMILPGFTLEAFSASGEKADASSIAYGESAITPQDEYDWEAVRQRIIGVYNNDGPGYHDYGIFHLGTYEEILPVYKHYVPNSSMIGMMLAHDYDYKAVKSTMLTGAFQHDLGTWKIKDGEIVTADDINLMAKITDTALAVLCSYASEKSAQAVDSIVTAFIDGLGEANLSDTAKHAFKSIRGALRSVKEVSPDIKDYVKESFEGVGKDVFEAIKTIRSTNIAELTGKAFAAIAR